MLHIAIKPADKLIKGYYDVLGGLGQLNFDHEGAVRSAFQNVLAGYGKKLHWTLVPEYAMKGRTGRIAVDGALIDEWKQRHGFWEAKERQKQAPIFVIIGNPPYNVGQEEENDANKNRSYPTVDRRISETYGKNSRAQSKSKLRDAYVRAFRWASDRLSKTGIVALITNNGFVEKFVFDGMRHHFARDFNRVYVVNLHGDIRKDSMRDGVPLGEKNTVFGLSAMVGIAVTFLIKNGSSTNEIRYAEVDFRSTRAQKFNWLEQVKSTAGVQWRLLEPDDRDTWLTEGLRPEFDRFIPISGKTGATIFESHGLGVSTNRDSWAYNFDREALTENINRTIRFYNTEVHRWHAEKPNAAVDEFVANNDAHISWSRDLKNDLKRGRTAEFKKEKLRLSLYRPFTASWLFFDHVLNEEVYRHPSFFPQPDSENVTISLTDVASRLPFTSLCSNRIPNLHVGGAKDAYQCFPFYTYSEDGANRRENITDWALEQFRSHYHDPSISKWDIFHYVYAVLHHPEYRSRYAANLKRELPRFMRDARSVLAPQKK